MFFPYYPTALWMILIQERKKINQQQQPSWGETSSHIFCRTHQHNKRQNKAAILCCCNLKSNNFHHPCHLTKKHWHKSNDDKDKWVTFSANHTVFCLLMFSIWNGWQKQGNREVIKLNILHILCHLLNRNLS